MRRSYFKYLYAFPPLILGSYLLNYIPTDGSKVKILQTNSALRIRKENSTLYTRSVGHLEQKKTNRRPRRRWKNNTKIDLKRWSGRIQTEWFRADTTRGLTNMLINTQGRKTSRPAERKSATQAESRSMRCWICVQAAGGRK
jgi:hypothetical protein